MSNQTHAYTKAGFIDEYGGREWFNSHNRCPFCQSELQQLGSFHQAANNLATNNQRGLAICLNCGVRDAQIDSSRTPLEQGDFDFDFYFPKNVSPGRNCFLKVAICQGCGWWYVIENGDACNDGRAAIYTGILETFDLSTAQIPIQVLEAELVRHAERIDGIHPHRMEDLLARVLRGVYDCEVCQLGYTRDGGVDLVVLNGDRQIAVQIKRRSRSELTEGVSAIREFLGAAVLRGDRELIYVTNAKRFSGQAHMTAEEAVSKHIVEGFDLISRDRLFAMLRSHNPEPHWRSSIQSVMNAEYNMPAIPDPYRYTSSKQSGG